MARGATRNAKRHYTWCHAGFDRIAVWQHPGLYDYFSVLEEYAGRFAPTYDYQTPPNRPLHFANETTYTGDPTIMSHQPTREWIHSPSAVLDGLIDAGLTITMFREHEVLPWRV